MKAEVVLYPVCAAAGVLTHPPVISSHPQLVEKGTKMVLENVITTIASVAGTAEEKFLVYYNR